MSCYKKNPTQRPFALYLWTWFTSLLSFLLPASIESINFDLINYALLMNLGAARTKIAYLLISIHLKLCLLFNSFTKSQRLIKSMLSHGLAPSFFLLLFLGRRGSHAARARQHGLNTLPAVGFILIAQKDVVIILILFALFLEFSQLFVISKLRLFFDLVCKEVRSEGVGFNPLQELVQVLDFFIRGNHHTYFLELCNLFLHKDNCEECVFSSIGQVHKIHRMGLGHDSSRNDQIVYKNQTDFDVL